MLSSVAVHCAALGASNFCECADEILILNKELPLKHAETKAIEQYFPVMQFMFLMIYNGGKPGAGTREQ